MSEETSSSGVPADAAAPRGAQRLILTVVKPREPTVAEGIENCLANPWNSFNLSRGAHAHVRQPPTGNVFAPDQFLVQLKQLLAFAWQRLDELNVELRDRSYAQVAFDDRTRARELIRQLNSWITMTVLARSTKGDPSPDMPLTVPPETEQMLTGLARIGSRLAMVWVEVDVASPTHALSSDVSKPNDAAAKQIASEAEQAAQHIAHATDFSWLRVGDVTYEFTTVNQRGVIRVLFESWELAGRKDGCGLTIGAIADALDTPSARTRVDKLFKENGALGTILRKSSKDAWALYLLGP